MGRVGEQPPGPVLPPDPRGPPAARAGSARLGALRSNHGAVPRPRGGGGMRRLRAAWTRLRSLLARERLERELADELESHLQMHIDDKLARGVGPEEARRQALLALGGLEATKERYRDRRGLYRMESLARDVRFGARSLARDRTFSAVAVLTLALGIGANSAIFSVVNAVLLRPLPYPDADRLAMVFATDKARGEGRD